MKRKWEYILVRPGVLALSGTPYQIRRESLNEQRYVIYVDDKPVDKTVSLEAAKGCAQRRARELFDIGLLEEEECK